MKKIYLLLSLISIVSYSQQKKDWFFGAELGLNTITSFNLGEPNKSFQGGILAEYYMGNHWSLTGKIKYFETGVSFFKAGINGTYLGSETKALIFKGNVLSLPLTVKWNYKLFSKLRGNLKVGLAYNFETKSNYELAINIDTNKPKSFGSFTAGFGLDYALNKKTIFYLDFETYQLGGYKANNGGFIINKGYYTDNNLINIGIKHNLKK